MGLAVTAGGQQDITLGGASFHAQALTALGLGGAGANLEVALGGDPPVDSRLLVGPIYCRLCCAMESAGMQDLASFGVYYSNGCWCFFLPLGTALSRPKVCLNK